MAGKPQTQYATGRTVFMLIRNLAGQIWNTGSSSFTSYLTAEFSDYVVAMVEQGSASGYYVGTFPSAIPAGTYNIVAKSQAGGSPAESDATVSMGEFSWDGSNELGISDLATSGQLALAGPPKFIRGNMVLNFPFKLVSSADHVTPFVSGVVSGQISKDGAAFTVLQSGAFTEIGKGWYKTNLTSGDLSCNTAALVFTADGVSGGSADQRDMGIILQRTSGY